MAGQSLKEKSAWPTSAKLIGEYYTRLERHLFSFNHMKSQQMILFFVLAGFCAASAPTTNSTVITNATTKTKTMSYTLQFITGGEKDIHNPSEADIRAALTSHKEDFGPVFEIHSDGTDGFFAVVSEQDSHFSFQYAHDRKKVIYVSKKETFSIEDGVKAAVEFLKGSPGNRRFPCLIGWLSRSRSSSPAAQPAQLKRSGQPNMRLCGTDPFTRKGIGGHF